MSPLEKPQTFFYLMAIKALKNAEKVFKKFFFSLIAGPVTPPPLNVTKKKNCGFLYLDLWNVLNETTWLQYSATSGRFKHSLQRQPSFMDGKRN